MFAPAAHVLDDLGIARLGLAGGRVAEREILVRGELGPLTALATRRGGTLYGVTAPRQLVAARLPAEPQQPSTEES